MRFLLGLLPYFTSLFLAGKADLVNPQDFTPKIASSIPQSDNWVYPDARWLRDRFLSYLLSLVRARRSPQVRSIGKGLSMSSALYQCRQSVRRNDWTEKHDTTFR